ncbi:uncharacterized protein LOC129691728 [Psammomys obesus]|uniref:uncharacterized protein LOC129691728 n=1 Tax=Psammomys obesus TaxID=48139 RepID=UPI00245336F3|nr:uncharacterized protein LOC129691728 [Psammomys obesus]
MVSTDFLCSIPKNPCFPCSHANTCCGSSAVPALHSRYGATCLRLPAPAAPACSGQQRDPTPASAPSCGDSHNSKISFKNLAPCFRLGHNNEPHFKLVGLLPFPWFWDFLSWLPDCCLLHATLAGLCPARHRCFLQPQQRQSSYRCSTLTSQTSNKLDLHLPSQPWVFSQTLDSIKTACSSCTWPIGRPFDLPTAPPVSAGSSQKRIYAHYSLVINKGLKWCASGPG